MSDRNMTSKNDLDTLIDCLRHRPVATTAAQMREAADVIERLHGALSVLYPGLVLDLRYCDEDDDRDALQSRVKTVEEALQL